MYVKKIHQFLTSIKKDARKRNLVPFSASRCRNVCTIKVKSKHLFIHTASDKHTIQYDLIRWVEYKYSLFDRLLYCTGYSVQPYSGRVLAGALSICISVFVSVCVCRKSEFYGNGRTNPAGFGMDGGCLPTFPHCVPRKFGYLWKLGYFTLELWPKLRTPSNSQWPFHKLRICGHAVYVDVWLRVTETEITRIGAARKSRGYSRGYVQILFFFTFMGLLQLRFEHDSSTIRARYNILRGVMCFRAIMNMSILLRCCRML